MKEHGDENKEKSIMSRCKKDNNYMTSTQCQIDYKFLIIQTYVMKAENALLSLK